IQLFTVDNESGNDDDLDGVPDDCQYVLFRRADVNQDRRQDIADAVAILAFLFTGGAEPRCQRSADVDGNGSLSVTDPIALLNFLFLGGAPPAEPFAECGNDPDQSLSCIRPPSLCP
ncbi:MAG: hypothetical protein AAF517_24295, partial [Planctomycetota bacterium]